MNAGNDVVVAGIGMHPWGKFGRSFVEYGRTAARAALADAGIAWADVQMVAGANTWRGGYPGLVSGSTFAHALGWNGASISSSFAACASGAQALAVARANILAGLCDVALVVGSDTTPKGFFGPFQSGDENDPDWLRFRLLGATNPTYFGLYAQRRIARYGATEHDFARVKAKNSRHGALNPLARYRAVVTEEEVLASSYVAQPLHLLDVCATSDGAAAVVLTSADYARTRTGRPVRLRAVATNTPVYPNTLIEMPNFASDSTSVVAAPKIGFKTSLATTAYAEAGLGPDDLHLAEVYDLSTALELDWYEHIGLCAEGEAEKILADGRTTLGGSTPVNPSGGLASFGEAVPAQAIAQVCELTSQLRGDAGARQVEGARVGLAVNQGLFGHGSASILSV
ncbi:lipid-transfer protein [Streptomyces sp. GQFP]|uniref:lipid-transfer protein n=1 Tax=Streptomyces sp. GQFP TaxID=2907545 RepID=UPI001F349620|nr:lipid-transfer protein [Streptomyces sp. GQFP]UIX31971.1 lipid-transfer protein [Streptomyces sp. GQFP]